LDLNGHFLHFNETGSNAPFMISEGKTFTIKDSSAEGDNPEEIDAVSDETVNTNYNYAANNELDDNTDTDTVTYYVTQSSASGTATTESTKKHVYTTRGYIVGDIKQGKETGIVYVSRGATFNLQSGLLTAHTNYDNGYDDGHSVFNCGIFNMTGGYIVGRKSNQKGAGICATSGSTTNLSGGVIAANTTTDGGAGVYVDNASLNLNGTIISGNQSNSRGGGIYGESATITISHLETNSSIYGVVTNNSSKESSSYYGGGGIYAHNGTLNIYDGVISRNYVDESNGGGIFADGCATTVTGGHISYNYAHTSIENTGTGFYGGGGIATVGSSLTISGGTVDHNTSSWGGGGIMVGSYDGNEWVGTEFKLTGGSISDNTAGGEGGGLRISQKSTDCIIEGSANNRVYIKNNKCETTKDWGGGGIFIQEGGKLSIYNAKITANKAGVYGGGVASCPSGSTVLNMANVALYANEAEGYKERTSTHKNTQKSADYDANNFDGENKKYAQDYYAITKNKGTIARLYKGILGGEKSNWIGLFQKSGKNDPDTYDIPGDIEKIDTGNGIDVSYIIGLTAKDPDVTSKTEQLANVQITENESYMHGGGIMTNGTLLLGSKTDNNVYPTIDITGSKKLEYINTTTETSYDDGDFKFLLLDQQPFYNATQKKWYYNSSSTSDDELVKTDDDKGYLSEECVQNGKFHFDRISTEKAISRAINANSKASQITLYLIEEIGNDDTIQYSTDVYKIVLNFNLTSANSTINGQTITNNTYTLSEGNVYLNDSSKSLYQVDIDQGNGKVDITSANGTFVNEITPVNLKIVKYQGTASEIPQTKLKGAEFMIYTDPDGRISAKKIDGSEYSVLTSNQEGIVTFDKLGYGTYYLKETKSPDGYKGLSNLIKVIVNKNGVSFTDPCIYHSGNNITASDSTYTVSYTKDSSGNRTAELDIPNSTGTVLPSTGGIGTDWFILGGCGLISIALIYALLMHSNREGGDLG
jgi:LPXTG-motif cell wall-anchored protein